MKKMTYKKINGFTLIELMITIVIVAILVSNAVPAMRDFLQNQTVLGTITTLSADVQYARSEAVDKKTEVEICPSSNGKTCANTDDWTIGWIVHMAEKASCPAPNDCVLRVRQTASAIVTLNASVSEPIVFDESGATTGNVTFALCRPGEPGDDSDVFLRTLEIKTSGSKYIRKGVTLCNP